MSQAEIIDDLIYPLYSDFQNPLPQLRYARSNSSLTEDSLIMGDTAFHTEKKRFLKYLHFFSEVLLFLALMNLVGFSIGTIYCQDRPSMAPIFASAMAHNLFHIILNAAFYFCIDKKGLLKIYYFVDCAFGLTKLIMYSGFYLYSLESVGEHATGFFVYPDLCARLGFYCWDHKRGSLVSIAALLYTFSLLAIAAYVKYKLSYVLWIGFVIYYLFGMALMIAVLIAWIVFGYLLVVFVRKPEMLGTIYPALSQEFVKKMLAYVFFCNWLTLHVLTYFIFVWGVQQFVIGGLLKPSAGKPETIPESLRVAGKYITILGVFDLLICSATLCVMRGQIRTLIEKFKVREITLQSFRKSVVLNLQMIGDNYFKRESDDLYLLKEMQEKTAAVRQNDKFVDALSKVGECLVCIKRESQSWFEPCGHSVVCHDCLRGLLKKCASCIYCQTKIEKVHLLRWDSQLQRYKSKGFYNLKAS